MEDLDPVGERILEMSAPPEPALTKWQLTISDLLMEQEKDLRGERWVIERDSEGNEYGKWKTTKYPIMNDRGIKEVMSVIRSHINKISFLTNLTDLDIERICKKLHIVLAKLLILKQRDYALDLVNYEITIKKIMNPIYMGLKKSLNQGEREFLKQTERRIERISEPSGRDKKSWVPFMR